MKPWVFYSLIRVLLFAAILTVLLLAGTDGWIAAIIAALLGFGISWVLFRKQRDAVAQSVYELRHGDTKAATPDEDAEDAIADNAEVDNAGVDNTLVDNTLVDNARADNAWLEGDRPRKD